MLSEKLEDKLKQKIKVLNLNDQEQELLLKELDILSDVIVKNVQASREKN